MIKQLCCLIAAGLFCTGAAAANLLVIVSAKSSSMNLRANQVADIFLAQDARFPNGTDVTPLDLPVGSSVRDLFYQKVTAKTPALVRVYWTKMVFTGRGQPPREISNSVAMRKLVAANPGFIGYIDSAALDDSVQVVLAVGK
ncbi:phosphate ABC transporter substrate-binding protein [Massilia sp. DWR3-1-1]|uniref:phosphate ABC transporter substrate-binding protein n=1 Tax=Massilia sp. DWR3-1-1 TaxID=2804559 RepID=UPI003CF71012